MRSTLKLRSPAFWPARLYKQFYAHVDKPTVRKCWLWVGSTNHGYGQLFVNGSPKAAHRISWELHIGQIPGGMDVLHKCEHPSCVNPLHLYIGRRKGQPGESNAAAKLSARDVREILRCTTSSQVELAERYRVSASTISRVFSRQRWGRLKA